MSEDSPTYGNAWSAQELKPGQVYQLAPSGAMITILHANLAGWPQWDGWVVYGVQTTGATTICTVRIEELLPQLNSCIII